MRNKPLFLVLACATLPLFAAEFHINVKDAAGTGFASTAPVAPLADNTGTTLGQQRVNVLARAMEIWGAQLESDVVIQVDARMTSLTCDTNSGSAVLASAGAIYVARGFQNAPDGETYFPPALANSIAGLDTNSELSDITVQVNINIDENAACANLFGGWYYGYDHNNGNKRDLLSTLLHELGHGLGFQSFVNSAGDLFDGRPDVFTSHIYDLEAGLTWTQMNKPGRAASALNDPYVVWNGANTNSAAATSLTPNALVLLRVDSPAEEARKYSAFESNFGPTLAGNVTGQLVYVTPADACSAISGDLTGKIAMIDRGTCEFGAKALAAQTAGAIGVIIVNNQDTALFVPNGGAVGNQVTIPTLFISRPDGDRLKGASGLTVTMGRDPDPAGTNDGYMRLHAPFPYVQGSSISHFTEEASPELLMEPNSSDELSDDLDLTIPFFKDMGWATNERNDAYRMVFPWLSNRSGEFSSILIANNVGSSPASVTLTARRASGAPIQTTATIPARGFLERDAGELFPGLGTGPGFAVELGTNSPDVFGRWVTLSLQAASGASPAQGTAARTTDTTRAGQNLLFGYLPNTGTITSAPVIVNTGDAATAVTLYFYGSDGTLLLQNNSTITALEPLRPFALPIASLLPGSSENVSMIARSNGQPITGAVFVFDSTFNEPAIGAAQVIEFNP